MLLQTNGYLIVIMEKYEITEASRAKGGLLLLLRAVPKGGAAGSFDTGFSVATAELSN